MPKRPPLSTIGSDPDYRFTFANERTFLAWIRTALALVAAGVAVIQILATESTRTEALVVGVPLISFGAVMPLFSLHRWRSNEAAMRRGESLPATNLLALLGWWVTVTAVVAGVAFLVAMD